MAWQEVAMAIGQKIVEEVAAAIVDEFTGNELQAAFDDAIEQIRLNTKRELEASTHKDLQGVLNGLVNSLREYRAAPTDIRLELITNDCRVFLIDRLKTLDLYDPCGHGLLGHPDFLIAAGLYLAILQERAVAIDEANKQNVVTFLSECISHAEAMHSEWQEWNKRRFGPVIPVKELHLTGWEPGSSLFYDVTFYYVFDGKTEYASYSVISEGPLEESMLEEATAEAERERQQHIAAEWEKLKSEFVDPSIEVVEQWRELEKAMEEEMQQRDIKWLYKRPLEIIRGTVDGFHRTRLHYYRPSRPGLPDR